MPAPAVDRRQLLQLATAAAMGLALPAAAQPRWSSNPFSLGVASGSPAPDSVVLWTRLLPDGGLPDGGRSPVPVRWEIAHDAAFREPVQQGEAMALPQLAHSVHVEPAGLAPDRVYFYRFTSGEAVSAVGRTRTLPLPGAAVARLRLAYASCQRWEHGRYGAWRHLQDESVDAVVFLGDYIYEAPSASLPVRNVLGQGWARTLEDYRERHALYRGDPDLQAMHAACPWLLVWDDHEVQNDYAGVHPGDGRPGGLNAVSDFAARRAAAHQAYYEHMPLRAAQFARALAQGGAAGELRLHGGWRFGQLADVLLLDDRQYRDPQACRAAGGPARPVEPGQCPEWADPARTLLGARQEAWLDGAFAAAAGTWTVVGQQTLFGRRDLRPGPGEVFSSDGWDGYPAARQRVLDGLQRHRVANPVFLGGDVHEHWVGHVKADYAQPASATLGVELCGTSITSRPGSPGRVPQRLADNPHFVFADAAHRGYGIAEFTPRRLTATLRGLADAARLDTPVSTLAQFTVAAGSRRLERQ